MIKPNSLRAHLLAALPELQRDPDKLQIFIDAGRLVSTGAPGISFEYRYTLNILVTDYAGHPDSVMVPLLAWAAAHQPELFHNIDQQRQGITFEADLLDRNRVDLSIELPLTERVVVKPRPAGGYDITHCPEPAIDEPAWPAGHWQVYLQGELIAEWTVPG